MERILSSATFTISSETVTMSRETNTIFRETFTMTSKNVTISNEVVIMFNEPLCIMSMMTVPYLEERHYTVQNEFTISKRHYHVK
jgi:hypothetical protein